MVEDFSRTEGPERRESASDSHVRLPDGRTLRYAARGPVDGTSVLFFHGTPGARTCVPDVDALETIDVRLLTVDRPGYGGSSPHAGRTLLDWSDDVAQLADALSLDEFAVVGLSGGGPHALACAVALPERVTNVGIISGMAPFEASDATDQMSTFNRLGFLAARHAPFLLPLALRPMARKARADPMAVVEESIPRYALADQRIMQRLSVRQAMARELTEAYRQGADGHVVDLKAVSRSWGFACEEITVPVHLWHGEEDRNAPLPMAESLAETIPNAHLTVFPDEGHLIAYDHFQEILAALVDGDR